MPGHTVSESLKDETTQTLIKIEDLVKEHDVIFLLTDSRESRWLPTMMAVAYNKVRYTHDNHSMCSQSAQRPEMIFIEFSDCYKRRIGLRQLSSDASRFKSDR